MATLEKRWVCTICGYVHQGAEPPECCPICGSTPDLFELQPQSATPADPVTAEQWTCLNCDYLHRGQTPPPACPVCGLPAEQFVPGRVVASPPRFGT